MKEEAKTILLEIIEKLRREYKPLRTILFGSYAYGNPTEDGDIDLLILKDTKKRRFERGKHDLEVAKIPKFHVRGS